MMRALKKWGGFVAVAVACTAAAAYVWTNDAGARISQDLPLHIADLSQTLRLRLQPDNAHAYINRGNAKGDLGQYQDAISDYDQALQLQPGNAHAYDHRGFARFMLGQYQNAIADYDQALQLRPGNARAYHNRILAKLNLGQSRNTFPGYDQTLHLQPDLVDGY